MVEQFPNFAYSETSVAGERLGLWVGEVQPISSPTVPFDLVDDLYHNRPVVVSSTGVQHWHECDAVHCHAGSHGMRLVPNQIDMHFQLEVTYNGTSGMPRCRVISSSKPLLKQNHVWNDGAMCAFLASDWNWESLTVADAMRDHFIWLVKWMVFNATDTWIGSEHENHPAYHLQKVGKKNLCWCGSGIQYRRCCRPRDLQVIQAANQRRIGWLELLRRN